MTLGNTSKAITVKSIEKLKNGAGRIIATAHYTDNVGNIDYYTLSGDKKLWTTEGILMSGVYIHHRIITIGAYIILQADTR